MGLGPLWSPSDVLHLRWYAERGLSQAETALLMNRPVNGVAKKASDLKISFHGQPGAPFLNNNARKWRLRQRLNSKSGRIRAPRHHSVMAAD